MTELLYLIAFELYLLSLYLVSWYSLSGWWQRPTLLGGIIQVTTILASVGIYLLNRNFLKPSKTTASHLRFLASRTLVVLGILILVSWLFFRSHPIVSQLFDHWVEILFVIFVSIQITFSDFIQNRPEISKLLQKAGDFVEKYSLFLIFLVVIISKISFLSPRIHNFVVLDDTYTYWQMARHFFLGDFDIRLFNHYPPLYPIALIPALLFNSLHIYQNTTILNSFYSSTTIFPLYLLSRQFFSKRMSLLFSFTSVFYLYHLIFPGLMMSENISLPLFLWTVYLSYSKPPAQSRIWLWDILLGVSIGLFWLSRYLALPLVPVFLIIRYLRDRGTLSFRSLLPVRKDIQSQIIIVSVLAVFESLWLIPGLVSGVPFQNLLGFQIASNEAKREISISSLLFWSGISASYFILMAIPILPTLVKNTLAPKTALRKINVWQLSIFLLFIVFFITVTRHAFQAGYNANEPIKFVGRYILYLTPLLWLSAFQNNQKPVKQDKEGWITLILSLILFGVAYLNLFHPGSFILEDLHPFLSPDMVVPWMIDGLFIFQVAFFSVVFFISTSHKSKISTIATLTSFLIISNVTAFGPVQKYTQNIHRNGYFLDAIIQNVNDNSILQPTLLASKELNIYITDDPHNFPKELDVRGLSERVSGIKMLQKDPLQEMNCRTRIALELDNKFTFALISDSENCRKDGLTVIKLIDILSEPLLLVQVDNIYR